MPRITKAHALRLISEVPEPFSLDAYLDKLRAVQELMRRVRHAVTATPVNAPTQETPPE